MNDVLDELNSNLVKVQRDIDETLAEVARQDAVADEVMRQLEDFNSSLQAFLEFLEERKRSQS